MRHVWLKSSRAFMVGALTLALSASWVLAGSPIPGRTEAPTSFTAAAIPAADRGPLDPLTEAEMVSAFEVIEAHQRFPAGAFFPSVLLKEPPKGEVLGWSPGQSFRREAFVNVYDRDANRLFEVVVDLRTERVVSWVERTGAQPPVFLTEFEEADAVVRADARWRRAIRDRGLRPNDVYLDVWAPGSVLVPNAPPGTRLLRAISFFQGDLPNPYDRPIEGVVVTVDMNRLQVVDFVDTGIKPVNTTVTGNADSTRTGLKRLDVLQPNGPSFKIKGRAVEWQGWKFRVGFDAREGLVLHQIGYEQNGVTRPIIHRISLSEIYVPYALPDRNWVWRAALDYGEYNLGQYSEPLEAKVDVPSNAVFFDEAAPGDVGTAGDPPAYALPHAIAMYERDGGPLWDRTDPTTFERDARFARELVVTTSVVIGNYTYTVDYIFGMDGEIQVVAGATGTTLNRGVSSLAEGEQFGGNVADHISAPNHQHYFSFRIDFDVDGPSNRVVEENTQSAPSAFGNAFVVNDTTLTTEQFRDLNPATDRHWTIQSSTRQNAFGEPTAYALETHGGTHPYSDPSYEPLQHAPFAQHPFWVTRYKDGELWAGGDYPNQGPTGEGLTKYVAGHENVNAKDVVVWYTASFTHHTRPEDFPVMPHEAVGFHLIPDGFFDENPALDAP
jgi:primary-amine oxidase